MEYGYSQACKYVGVSGKRVGIIRKQLGYESRKKYTEEELIEIKKVYDATKSNKKTKSDDNRAIANKVYTLIVENDGLTMEEIIAYFKPKSHKGSLTDSIMRIFDGAGYILFNDKVEGMVYNKEKKKYVLKTISLFKSLKVEQDSWTTRDNETRGQKNGYVITNQRSRL